MSIALQPQDFAALSPLLIILGGALALLLLETCSSHFAKLYAFPFTVAILVAAIAANLHATGSAHPRLVHWLQFDELSRLFTTFFLAVGIASAFLAAAFFQRYQAPHGEFFFLLLSAVFGLILIGESNDFLTLFLGLETLSIPLYVLCGYMKRWEISQEASLKYFLMGALATAFLLYGIALIYGAVGTTRFDTLLTLWQHDTTNKTLFLAGIALVTLGLSFKAAIVPFHIWAPDVYEGAPSPVTAFMAVGTKAGAFAAFIRLFLEALPGFEPLWNEAIALMALPTLVFANMVAIRQKQLRRFFAYSGISHAGYLLLPLAAGGADAFPAMSFYLIVYAAATFGAFAVMAFLDHGTAGVSLHDLQGLWRHSPLLAGLLSLCLLTLAGIPPTAGFFAKFYLFKVAFTAGYHLLVVVALLTTILSAFYYLRMAAVMFSEPSVHEAPPHSLWPATLVAVAACTAVVLLTLYPAPLLHLLSHAPIP